MFGKKKPETQKKDPPKVYCPLCRSSRLDGKFHGEGGRFRCSACGVSFSIDAIPKK